MNTSSEAYHRLMGGLKRKPTEGEYRTFMHLRRRFCLSPRDGYTRAIAFIIEHGEGAETWYDFTKRRAQ